ncbi:serine/threonine-protein kinase [Mariniblastus fucicola]|uniref:Serine/threonine-protein kinase PknD n=1 Tax=Mariniblastus fucicola TaxID=980251 RepID=A0A5B9PF65_9BACT|nr:serine/threonine-protein kinase [Mariniblastus fucicola]QEG21621.1 Serine/threonine-protein kinase PknD [Mariniblastus fucicola]
MSNDEKLSQLISQSLRCNLNADESADVESHLRESVEARKFAELSALIQNSVMGSAVSDSQPGNAAGGLSAASKQRLRDSIRGAVEEKLSLSQAGLLKNDPASGTRAQVTSGSSFSEGMEIRQVQSSFRLVRQLAQGGLGNVWLAQDEKLNRTIAIKELKSSALESPDAWQRFHREAEITGHLEHPNVVPLYLYGVDRQSGEPFYAMRFVGKRTLSNAIEEHHDLLAAGETGVVCLHRLLSVFLDICQAIAYAHSRGVVHRDLKPDNVALDNFGQVIVIDWGLAKVLEEGELATKLTSGANLSESALLQTMEGEAVGTPLYMSPEQAAGELDKIDHRTDVYGLGSILFSILTGKAPHEKSVAGTSPIFNSDLNAVLKVIATSDPPTACDYGKSVPRELEQICLKAMAKKQHMRYRSAEELASAVESWMAGQNGKQAAYDTLRMEGRELRADMQATARDMERNIRFVAGMPPIQQLINLKSDEEIRVWRERLSTIFQGLLKATPYFRSFAYTQVTDGQFQELVRVERHSHDASTIRVVPRSHLSSGTVSEFIQCVVDQKPDEVYTSIVNEAYTEGDEQCHLDLSLLAGVPIYDELKEDVFGCVLIECDINQLLREQLGRNSSAAEIMVACTTSGLVLLQSQGAQIVENRQAQTVSELSAHFSPTLEALRTESDFIDEQDSEIFGASLWFVPNERGISYLLTRRRTEN